MARPEISIGRQEQGWLVIMPARSQDAELFAAHAEAVEGIIVKALSDHGYPIPDDFFLPPTS